MSNLNFSHRRNIFTSKNIEFFCVFEFYKNGLFLSFKKFSEIFFFFDKEICDNEIILHSFHVNYWSGLTEIWNMTTLERDHPFSANATFCVRNLTLFTTIISFKFQSVGRDSDNIARHLWSSFCMHVLV